MNGHHAGEPCGQNPAYRPADIFYLPKKSIRGDGDRLRAHSLRIMPYFDSIFSRGWACEIMIFGHFMQVHFSKRQKFAGLIAAGLMALSIVADTLDVFSGAVDLYSYLTTSSSKETPLAKDVPLKSDRLTEKENNTTSLTLDRAAEPEAAETLQFSEPDIQPKGPLKRDYPVPPPADPFATVSDDTPVPGRIDPIKPYNTTSD